MRLGLKTSLTIVSWNTGERYRLGNKDNWTPDASLSDVARRLQSWSPEIVCLQEIRSQAQLEVLLERLGPSWSGSLSAMPASDRQIAILTRLPTEHWLIRELPTSTGRHAMELTYADRGQTVRIVGCHGHAYSASSRRTYFETLFKELEAAPSGEIVLLLGDFNMDPWLAFFTGDRYVFRRLKGAWSRLLRGRHRTCMGLLHLDHAYLRGESPGEARAHVVRGTRAYRRDHDPLQVVLSFEG